MEIKAIAKTPQQIKAERLNNSLPFDVHVWSEYSEVNSAVDYLFEKYQKSKAAKMKQHVQKKHIKVLVLDLYVKHLLDPAMYIAISRRKEDYVKRKGRYNALHISFVTVDLMDWMEEEALIEIGAIGVNGKDGIHGSFQTRIRATARLIGLIVEDFRIEPSMIDRYPETECIVLKNADKKEIEYKNTPERKQMRTEVTAYNNLLRRSHIDIPDVPGQKLPVKNRKGKGPKFIYIGESHKFVKRVFNNGDWGKGGRYAGGWWQRIPKVWREKIRINNLPTSEIDYSGLHIVLLYAKVGIDYWKEDGADAYYLPGYAGIEQLRDWLKLALLIIINNGSKIRAIRAFRKKLVEKNEYDDFKSKGLDVNKLFDDFETRHNPINEFFYSNAGLGLQNMDSMIAQEVVNHFTDKQVPILCIHDSFIVQASSSQELHAEMIRAYQDAIIKLGVLGAEVKMKDLGWKPGKWQKIYSDPAGKSLQDFFKEQLQILDENPEYRMRWKQHLTKLHQGYYKLEWYVV